MSSKKEYRPAQSVSSPGSTRRQLLATSGIVAVSALSGCLNRVASATTNTAASPAAPFAGVGEYTGPSPAAEPTVYKLTPTVAADIGPFSDEVELEAWVTSKAIAATCCFDYNSDGDIGSNRANYNNSRSNKSKIRSDDADSDGGGLGDRDYNDAHYNYALRAALDLENTLLSQTKAAADSISKRSARTGRSHIGDMSDTIESVKDALARRTHPTT